MCKFYRKVGAKDEGKKSSNLETYTGSRADGRTAPGWGRADDAGGGDSEYTGRVDRKSVV